MAITSKLLDNKIEQEFKTPLGIVRCGLTCARIDTAIETRKYENSISEIFHSKGHKIELISFKISVPLYNGGNLTDSMGWIFRIEKVADINDKIETYCLLENNSNDIIFGTATGEHLDAVEAHNSEWILHIGTENGEIMNSRAGNEDWFPLRLKSTIDFYQSITEIKQNGFLTKIPELDLGEKIHIQYLCAYDKKDEEKVNTWLAVDETKRNLENWIGIW
jgi:hypothetical protein